MPNWPNQRLCDVLNIEHPIIQAPMAGASTPQMAAIVANAGGVGSLGCAMMSAPQVIQVTAQTRALTSKVINLNFFSHETPRIDAQKIKAAQDRLQPWYDQLADGNVPTDVRAKPAFDREMCDAVLKSAPNIASFHFGLPDAIYIRELKTAGILILSSATSVAEARWLVEHGVDAIIAQGYEAGGHNGWFLPRYGAQVAGTVALVPRIVDAVDVPVVAAGGIADGRGIAAAFALGAAGVQIGTAFLATPESATSAIHKETLIAATGDDTKFSKAFSGRDARTLVNTYSNEMDRVQDWPDFPLVNALTNPLRAASATAHKPDAVSLWAGQAAVLVGASTTQQVFDMLLEQATKVYP